jgi:hypothetical protein
MGTEPNVFLFLFYYNTADERGALNDEILLP